MVDVSIATDGTIEGTKLLVDGKEVTTDENIVSMVFHAEAAWTSSYSGTKYPGQVYASYRYEKDGQFKSVSVGSSSDSTYNSKIGEIKSEDSVNRYVGLSVDSNIKTLADEIHAFCTEKEIKCIDKTNLYNRSMQSLTDKAHDLGIVIES